jgi:hypothetical protein
MANSLKTWMILDNLTADIPAAGDTGAHGFDTTSTILRPYYDDGTNLVPWRSNISMPVFGFALNAVAHSYVTTAAYASVFTGSMMLDFTRFREGRFTTWASKQIASADITVKVRDTTNGQDITDAVAITNTTAQRWTSAAWTALNSATYGGDREFEVQAFSAAGGDTLKVFSFQLELR